MIKAEELIVEINNNKILNGVSLRLPKTGLIGISGPSGCGKTTLLNCLAGLLPYKGSIEIDKRKIEDLNENQLTEFRLGNIGYVFQDFKLFENQTVEDNISLAFVSNKISNSKDLSNRLDDILEILEIKSKRKQVIKNLSGGEKQRVAIARSLMCEPKVILCDEPTGNLDSKNTTKIMEILHNLSSSHLVVIVSHDLPSLIRYCNEIYCMEDGLITKKEDLSDKISRKPMLVKAIKTKPKRQKVGSSFLLKYCFSKIKQKQVRSFISISISALGLMSFGLSFSLTESISSNIKNVYSSSIQDDRILLTKKKENNKQQTIESIDEAEFKDIRFRYRENIANYGYYYYFDFENGFPNQNEVVLNKSGYAMPFEGLSIRSFNDFQLIKDEEVYPHKIEDLDNNEVVLGLNLATIQELCYELRIKRTVESLSNYLQVNSVPLLINLSNVYWSYSAEKQLNMVGFVLSNSNSIFHTNNLFNEYIIEHSFGLPSSNNIYGVLKQPWIVRKVPYIESDNTDLLLEESLTKMDNQKYIFELNFDTKNHPNKIFLFRNSLSGLSPYVSSIISENNLELSKPIFGTNYGHFIYPTMLLMGFSYQTYLSASFEKNEEVINVLESIELENTDSVIYPDGIYQSYFLNLLQNSFVFDVFDGKLHLGNTPMNYSEILISSSLAKSLFDKVNVIGEKIYLSHIMSETISENNHVLRTFLNSELTICGVVDSNANAIYHNPYWTIIYYQKFCNVSRFLLDVQTISFEVKNPKRINEICEKLNNEFKGYNFENPLKEMNSGIDEVCSYVSMALMFFSIITFIITILFMVITNYLHISENTKDFGLLMVIGIKRKETRKFLYSYSLIVSLLSFVLSVLYLSLVKFVINLEISSLLQAPLSFSFDYLSLIMMLIVSLLLGFISTIFLNKKIAKIRPIDIFKQ